MHFDALLRDWMDRQYIMILNSLLWVMRSGHVRITI